MTGDHCSVISPREYHAVVIYIFDESFDPTKDQEDLDKACRLTHYLVPLAIVSSLPSISYSISKELVDNGTYKKEDLLDYFEIINTENINEIVDIDPDAIDGEINPIELIKKNYNSYKYSGGIFDLNSIITPPGTEIKVKITDTTGNIMIMNEGKFILQIELSNQMIHSGFPDDYPLPEEVTKRKGEDDTYITIKYIFTIEHEVNFEYIRNNSFELEQEYCKCIRDYLLSYWSWQEFVEKYPDREILELKETVERLHEKIDDMNR